MNGYLLLKRIIRVLRPPRRAWLALLPAAASAARRRPTRNSLRTFERLEAREVLDSTVVFNEIMYHPAADAADTEWIELTNQMTVDMDLSGWSLAGGVDYDFPRGTIVPGGGFLVIAARPGKLAAATGFAAALGPFTGTLANAGERLELRSNSGRLMDQVHFGDQGEGPVAADGSGATLAKWDPTAASGPAANWASSGLVGGTPGAANTALLPALADPRSAGAAAAAPRLRFSELAAATADLFWIELVNLGASPLDLAGYVVSADAQEGRAVVLPDRTLAPGELLLVPDPAGDLDVAAGDRLFLYDPARQFVLDAQVADTVPRGRAAELAGRWLYPAAGTPGSANRFAFHDEIVINEIMYHHRLAAEPADSAEEWIELYNRSATPVDLTGWRLGGGIQYALAAGTVIEPGEYLVVAGAAGPLALKYPAIDIVGDFSGRLSNTGDRIVLVDAAGNPADQVHYYDGGRWPDRADGGGSSLELRDPDADNASALAWQASAEGSKSSWQTYTYRGIAAASAVGPDGVWEEFVLGLLAPGEVLLDDIQVVEDPDGAATALVENGSFESGADAWRLLGNHRHSQVIVDPDDAGNHVLRLVATGPTEHMNNHLETTLADGRSVVDGRLYEISLRGKWIGGSNQLHTRLYFNRLAHKTVFDQPRLHGTPGAANSRREDNIGPTLAGMRHAPVVPAAAEAVTVSVVAADPDGVDEVTLWWSVAGGPLQSSALAPAGGGRYAATLPGQPAATVVQFYVEARDRLGASATFPRAGADSRALYQVQDGLAATGRLQNLRIVMTPDDAAWLHEWRNLMSNDWVGATVISNEQEVFYDVGVRLKGSERGRVTVPRLGFVVEFQADQLFRGVHRRVAIDRSEGIGFGQREMLINQFMTLAGGVSAEYNDLIQVIAPKPEHTGPAELQLARFGDVLLDSQFTGGSAGTLFEYELVYFPRTADADGFKLPQPDDVLRTDIRDLGDSAEDYRWNFLIKNNRAGDDYSRLIEFAKVFSLRGVEFNERVGDVIDVDQWLRALALSALSGAGDQYFSNSGHNGMFYVRPEDGRVLYFPHDLDFAFSAARSITENNDLKKIIADPARRRTYYGYLLDILDTVHNTETMTYWANHFGSLLPGQDFAGHLAFLAERSESVRHQLAVAAPGTPFQITSSDFEVDQVRATIAGTGWIDVREIRLAGSADPLVVSWTDVDSWQATVPLAAGPNQLTLEAYDYQGNRIATDKVVVTSTVRDRPLRDFLRITEINYNPYAPTAAESTQGWTDNDDFEFIELQNSSSQRALDLAGAELTGGVQFTFGDETLGPGQFVLVVQNRAAFESRYGPGLDVAGTFAGARLNNAGERIVLRDAAGLAIDDFTYGDHGPWPSRADGQGSSLETVDPANDYRDGRSWRASSEYGGAPGRAGAGPVATVVINEVLSRSTGIGPDRIELLNTADRPVDLSGWYLTDSIDQLDRFVMPAGTTIDAGGYLVLTSSQLGFGLDGKQGEDLWLLAAEQGAAKRFVDHVRFGGAEPRVSFGRWPSGQADSGLFPLTSLTFGGPNSGPVAGDVVISEVHYQPPLTLLANDFNDGSAGRFKVRSGSWRVRDGVYEVTPGVEGDTASTISGLGSLAGPFRLSASVTVPTGSGFRTNAALIFDYHGPDNFKFASVHANTGRWRIGQRDGEKWRVLAERKQYVPADVPFEMVLEITGSVATLRLDGVPKVSYDFGVPLGAGHVGLGSKSGSALFDNVRVELPSEREVEFVELASVASQPIALAGWQLAGGVDFVFPAGTTIQPGAALVVVGFDPAEAALAAALRGRYGAAGQVQLVGPFGGGLDNRGATVTLERPLAATGVPEGMALVDRVGYQDQPPWPAAAGGPALARRAAAAFGDFAASWTGRQPTPGYAFVGPPGDLDQDGTVDADDLDDLVLALRDPAAFQALRHLPASVAGDLDGDGDLDFDDIDELLALLAAARLGAGSG